VLEQLLARDTHEIGAQARVITQAIPEFDARLEGALGEILDVGAADMGVEVAEHGGEVPP